MTKPVSLAHRFAGSPWTVLVGTVTSVGSFFWVFADYFSKSAFLLPAVSLTVSVALFFTIVAYSFHVRNENAGLKDVTGHLHGINHIYRDVLHACFSGPAPVTNREELIRHERETIRGVCQRIENIFSRLIGRDCLVTVKLITKDEKGNRYCTTYERSQDKCERDKDGLCAYEVGTGRNSAFDEALRMRHNGERSRFYSGDIANDRAYCNQRQHWEQFYRSAIVVPIRSPRSSRDVDDSDDLGFLCVDTMSRNRLKDSYHVNLMAAFADQMYNFFCLMRGTYNALAEERLEPMPRS